jgi:hypothetical protein
MSKVGVPRFAQPFGKKLLNSIEQSEDHGGVRAPATSKDDLLDIFRKLKLPPAKALTSVYARYMCANFERSPFFYPIFATVSSTSAVLGQS